MENSEGFIYAVAEGIATITLDHRDTRNAITRDDVLALPSLMARAADDESVGAVVIAAAGTRFTPGADLATMEALLASKSADRRRELERWQGALVAVERLEKPVVAAINGTCAAAGAALILACDIRIAAVSARICFPSVKAGLVTDLGCTRRLPRVVGVGWAKDILLTGRWVDAALAERIGLVTRVLPDEDFRAAVASMVTRELLPASTGAQGMMKRLIDENATGAEDAALESERLSQSLLYGTADAEEGFHAIQEKRSPRFGL